VKATAFGHPEVDVEHLLLGLMVVSGPSAEVPTAAGVEVTALRRALGEVQREDLGELGVDVATPQSPPVRAAHRPHQVLPLNGRAAELMEAVALPHRRPRVLEALLADGSGRVAPARSSRRRRRRRRRRSSAMAGANHDLASSSPPAGAHDAHRLRAQAQGIAQASV
jgi:Clp amino terminal domain, pathogenicity island component